MMTAQLFSLLVMTLLAPHVTSHTLYITPNDHYVYTINSSSTITLSQCVSNSEKCFISNSKLLFLSGLYYLQQDFILQNTNNITIDGNNSTIKCLHTNSSVGIAILNVTNIVLLNMKIMYCQRNYRNAQANTVNLPTYVDMPKLHWNAALHIHYCMSAIVTNVSVTVTSGTNGLVVVNALMKSEFNNVVISHAMPMRSSSADTPTSNGMVAYYYQSKESVNTTLYIQNFTYRLEAQAVIELEIENILSNSTVVLFK